MKSFRKHRKEFLYPDIEYPISFTIDNIFNGEIWKKSSSEIDNKKNYATMITSIQIGGFS